MTFKELMRFDAESFVEVAEFAELIVLDGVILKAQLIQYTQERSSNEKKQFSGLHGDYTEVHFKVEDYLRKRRRLPVEGEYCKVNGRNYVVESSAANLGIATLTLAAYRQKIIKNL